jgi:uncharacterized protein (DUF2126 family)
MTIFDSIKYPISNPPTVEELEALPRRLFHRWARKHFFIVANKRTIAVEKWYRTEANAKDQSKLYWREELQDLRNMIYRMRKS